MNEKEKNKTQIYSVKEGVIANIAIGSSDTFISPFFITLKISSFGLGLLSAISNIIGPIFQIIGSYLMKNKPRKEIIIKSVLFQSISYFLLGILTVLIFLKLEINIYWLILIFSMYVGLGSLGGPAWISLIGDIIEKEKLGQFFAFRNSIGIIASTLAGVLTGLFLDSLKLFFKEFILLGFAFIFLFTSILHFLRIFYFNKHYEPEFKIEPENYFSFISFIKKLPKTNFGRFVIITSLISFAVNISGPYYNLYIFRDLQFSYIQFLILNIVVSLASFFTFSIWGKIIDHYGSVDVLRASSFLISLVPLLWFFTIFIDNNYLIFIFLIPVHIIAGIGWGGYGLATTSFLYTAVSRPKRHLCSAYSSLIAGFCTLVGAFLGSALIEIFKFILPFNSIMFVSVISGILRFIFSFMLLFLVKEPLEIRKSLFEAIKRDIIKIENFIVDFVKISIYEINPFKIISRYRKK